MTIAVRPLREDERAWVRDVVRERWGGETVVAHGVVHRPAELEGLVAQDERGDRLGLLTFAAEGDACEIVTIDAFEEGRGVGTALLDAARALGYARLWLVTTNDNVRAQRLYESRGFRLVAVHEGAVARSRELKPEIPLLADDGTPIRDELEYELHHDRRGDELEDELRHG
jgi:ribosomal protein S18 acetylase RimI-like enzyme